MNEAKYSEAEYLAVVRNNLLLLFKSNSETIVSENIFFDVAAKFYQALATLSNDEYDAWLEKTEGRHRWLALPVLQTKAVTVSVALAMLFQGREIHHTVAVR